MKRVLINFFLIFLLVDHTSLAAQVSAGFHSIFNGNNLNGWHKSRTSHQGTTPGFKVEDGILVVRQHPFGQGGILLSDKKYKNFELYVEAKIDSGTNGGIFIRSSESGIAYQIEFDENSGSTGNLLGERMQVSKTAAATGRGKVWKPNNWNTFRIRMVGDIPHITLWINGTQMWDIKEPKNDFIAGAVFGMIGLQCHWTALYSPNVSTYSGLASWAPGATHHFRNIAIKELPSDLKE